MNKVKFMAVALSLCLSCLAVTSCGKDLNNKDSNGGTRAVSAQVTYLTGDETYPASKTTVASQVDSDAAEENSTASNGGTTSNNNKDTTSSQSGIIIEDYINLDEEDPYEDDSTASTNSKNSDESVERNMEEGWGPLI